MEESRNRIRVKPRTFEDGWRDDFLSLGIKIPKEIPTLAYTPVNHDPMPFSVEVDLKEFKIVKRIVGVMPNAVYPGHIFSWDEFRTIVGEYRKADHPADSVGRRNQNE